VEAQLIPTTIVKAVYAVLNSSGFDKRPEWTDFARIESDPESDLFVVEASDSAFAISIVFSNPTYANWGGCSWISVADMKLLKKGGDAATYLLSNPPSHYPEDMRGTLQKFAEEAAPEVDIHISPYYLHLISTILSHLSANTRTVEMTCTNPVGPLCLRTTGEEENDWIEVNLYCMGRRRESSN
jgi:hypothetical protein